MHRPFFTCFDHYETGPTGWRLETSAWFSGGGAKEAILCGPDFCTTSQISRTIPTISHLSGQRNQVGRLYGGGGGIQLALLTGAKPVGTRWAATLARLNTKDLRFPLSTLPPGMT